MVVFALAALLGAAALTVGVALLIPTIRFARSATGVAEGTVVGHDREEDHESVYFYPRIAFTANGADWQVRGKLGYAGRPRHRVGARVRVYFPPNDPGAAELSRFGGAWFAAAIAAVGAAFLAGAVREGFRWMG
jgi:hypothetical protein